MNREVETVHVELTAQEIRWLCEAVKEWADEDDLTDQEVFDMNYLMSKLAEVDNYLSPNEPRILVPTPDRFVTNPWFQEHPDATPDPYDKPRIRSAVIPK